MSRRLLRSSYSLLTPNYTRTLTKCYATSSSYKINNSLNNSSSTYKHSILNKSYSTTITKKESVESDENFNELRQNGEHSYELPFNDIPVKDILLKKRAHRGAVALVVNENEDVASVIDKMANEWNVGATLVVNDKSEYTGIFTERDFLKKYISKTGSGSLKEHIVKEFMTENFVSVNEDTSCMECLRLMSEGKFRRLPVKSNQGSIVGFISVGDLVTTIVREYRNTLRFYAEYVSGNYSAPITNTKDQVEKKSEKRRETKESQSNMAYVSPGQHAPLGEEKPRI